MWPKNRWERECNGQSDTLRLFGQVFSSILMASCIEIDRYGLIPLAVAPLPCRRPSSKTLVLTRPSSKFSLGLVLHGPRTVFRINRRRFITAVARTEPDRRGEDSATEVLQFCVFDNWFVFFWWLRKKYRKRCKFLNFDAWVCDCYSFFQKKWKIFSPVGAHGVLGSVGWIFWETKREPEVLKLKVSLFRNQIYIKNKDKNENSVFFAFPQVFLMDRWSLIDGSYFQVVVLIEPSGWIFLRVIMPLGCIFWWWNWFWIKISLPNSVLLVIGKAGINSIKTHIWK